MLLRLYVSKNDKLDIIINLLEAITLFFKGYKKLSGVTGKLKSSYSHSSNCSINNEYEQDKIRTYHQSHQ